MTLPSSFTLAVSMLSGVMVALDANDIIAVREGDECDPEELKDALDLGKLLGGNAGAIADRRVLTLFSSDEDVFLLVVGPDVLISEVDAERLHPLPRYLAGLSRSMGVVGLAEIESVALLFDPGQLRRALEQAA